VKILILGFEHCNLISNLSTGFKDVTNAKVHTAVLSESKFYGSSTYNYNLIKPDRRKGNKYFTKLVYWSEILLWKLKLKAFKIFNYYHYDLYIFTWSTLFPDYSDLKGLNQIGKSIIFLFIGSDIRWIEAFKQQYPDNSYKGFEKEDWINKFRLARNAELYCNSIFSVPDQSGLLIRGYFHMFMPLALEKIRYNPVCRVKPLIIHSPSKADLKGTDLILNVVDELRSEGLQFDFQFLEGVNNEDLIRKLEIADILIDQLYGNGPGTLATEAMAAGCAVATRFFKEYPLSGKAPMCYIDEHVIKENLRMLITDMDYRSSLVSLSREYVETHNSCGVVAKNILESLQREKLKQYDYIPKFFQEHFVLPKNFTYPAEISELNEEVIRIQNFTCG
jgi:hypothetical protein